MLLHSTVCEVTPYVKSVMVFTVRKILLSFCYVCYLCTFTVLPDFTSQQLPCTFNSSTHRSEELDLIHCCLRVVLRTLHHLHCNKPLHPATTEQVTFANRKHRTRSYHNSLKSQLLLKLYPTSGLKNKTMQ